MPHRSRKKQTRLAFASAPPETEAAGDSPTKSDGRFARLEYGHPSMASLLTGKSRNSQHAASKDTTPAKSSMRKHESKDKSRSKKKKHTIENENNQTSVKEPVDSASSEDDIVVPSTQKRKRRLPSTAEIGTRALHATDKPAMSDSKDPGSRTRRKLKRKAESSPIVLSDSEDSDEPVLSSPIKRRRRAADTETPQTPHSSADRDRLDIEEDLEDLQDSGMFCFIILHSSFHPSKFMLVVKKSRTRGRLAGSARDKRQKHLEALRRRRAGLKEESETESENETDPDESEIPTIQQTVDIRRITVDDSDVESAILSDEDLDRYEDDFVLEDEDKLGVPTEEIPFEFTRHAYKQLKEYFRDVVEWMVHNKLNPAFPRNNAMYKVAFMKLDDEVKGRAGSQLISSVWNADFCRALMARPQIEMTAFPTALDHPCDACNRSKHPASTDMKLYGKAYSLETLEPLNDDSSEDSDESKSSRDENEDEDSGEERDRDGHVLPPESRRFLLGRQCKAKAELAHTLTHWRFHLNEWVVGYLERKGHMDIDEVIKRNDMSQKRKMKNANAAVDRMVEADEIEKLWRDFHLNLKSARENTSTLG
ncbi:hypothetical protein N7474_000448 [Penicillium riverlandense]|uniref:uncharacterized protein n=1 Tax=Penicillium riverlandense TaxID=1903569 RepID=UPI0025495CE9|nr:uncharacterized protein N7474_000448 [Penicillium riverlandense]KAJ5832137.1 hypothetical protein N7474_000448 [Penicillium riverlandense]